MSDRIESPEAVVVSMTGVPLPIANTASAGGPAPARDLPLATAADLVSAHATSWHVRRTPALGVVSAHGEVRRTWSRGPRR